MPTEVRKSLLAGVCGACATSLLVTPLDVIKARLQVQRHSVVLGSHALKGVYSNLLKSEGIRGFWRGLGTTLFLSVPTTAVYMTLYDSLKDELIGKRHFSSEHAVLVAGTFSRCIVATVASPLELVRTSIQAGSGRLSVWELWKSNLQTAGVRGLFRGLFPTLVRDAPFSAIYWVLYERCKSPSSSLWKLSEKKQHSWLVYFLSGCISGMTAAAITTPADVVKTRRQALFRRSEVILGSSATPMNSIDCCSEIKASFWSCGKAIVRLEGYRGLFRGLLPRVAKVAPSCAIMMTSYEWCKKYLSETQDSDSNSSSADNQSTHLVSLEEKYPEWSSVEF
eukprot:jgi/Galph1/3463/GphlegSOOS_G2126.1